MLADVEQPALQAASENIAGLGVKTLAVPTDVSDEAAVNALAARDRSFRSGACGLQ